jgi:OOP family OmpA-OmpF porin
MFSKYKIPCIGYVISEIYASTLRGKTSIMKWFLTILLASFVITLQAQDYKLEGSEVKISKPVLFETGSAKLKPESAAALEIIVKYLTDKSYISQLRIECHTDNSGNAEANQSLSEKRALVICKKLIEMGVDCKRLIAVGFGDTKPVADNSTAEGKAENRRVSFVNVALRGRVIGGLPVDGGGHVAGEPCN